MFIFVRECCWNSKKHEKIFETNSKNLQKAMKFNLKRFFKQTKNTHEICKKLFILLYNKYKSKKKRYMKCEQVSLFILIKFLRYTSIH